MAIYYQIKKPKNIFLKKTKPQSGYFWLIFFIFFVNACLLAGMVFYVLNYKKPEIKVNIYSPLNLNEDLSKFKPEDFSWSANKKIGLLQPKDKDKISQPIILKGIAWLPQDKIYWRLKSFETDQKTKAAQEIIVAVGEASIQPIVEDYYGWFETKISFDRIIKNGILEIFGLDKNGQEIEKMSLLLTF